MKSKIITTLLASIGLFAAAGSVQAQTANDRVYVIDQRGEVVVSGTGLCWRTGFWTPAAAAKDPAGCKCDKDLLPKEVCEPAVAKAAPGAAAPPASKPSADKITVAADALFDFDKATLRPEGKAKLDEVVAKSKAINLELITATGHTDRFGSDAYNQKLSEKRAAAVKTYLVSKGIAANLVITAGKGKTQPVTKPDQCPGPKSKKTIACLQPDRRVDIEVIGNK
ncbi:MAG: OmpA family protein [Candidatus Accumulibacter phosphatis]|uniref:OmpA family protein n=1 Tax=Candidatus Accumulibacter cognatus TaxID=2954383 RepID=A0A080MDU7_9PROT|nr:MULTISPECIES: OmpA family protein [Candidatus Accumulibacter]MCQ1547982.1 OmpA family protein [Candidatus Accumulibacter phosphatis]KFB75399.1 MAG: Outer membrane protein II* [Candidatus Accumulibacter cognatus]MBL8402884.1 OmpA family protein [Accumulibacter sp.]MCM8623911.1 OmpA family protein [Accumulibacter sp.]QLH49972.1 MAG: OmpA family protein [Candidatus Accumulibacter cognatus]